MKARQMTAVLLGATSQHGKTVQPVQIDFDRVSKSDKKIFLLLPLLQTITYHSLPQLNSHFFVSCFLVPMSLLFLASPAHFGSIHILPDYWHRESRKRHHVYPSTLPRVFPYRQTKLQPQYEPRIDFFALSVALPSPKCDHFLLT